MSVPHDHSTPPPPRWVKLNTAAQGVLIIIGVAVAIAFACTATGDVPTHWNIKNEVDGWGSPMAAYLGHIATFGGLGLVLIACCLYLYKVPVSWTTLQGKFASDTARTAAWRYTYQLLVMANWIVVALAFVGLGMMKGALPGWSIDPVLVLLVVYAVYCVATCMRIFSAAQKTTA